MLFALYELLVYDLVSYIVVLNAVLLQVERHLFFK